MVYEPHAGVTVLPARFYPPKRGPFNPDKRLQGLLEKTSGKAFEPRIRVVAGLYGRPSQAAAYRTTGWLPAGYRLATGWPPASYRLATAGLPTDY